MLPASQLHPTGVDVNMGQPGGDIAAHYPAVPEQKRGGSEPSSVRESLLASLAMLSLARHSIVCATGDITVTTESPTGAPDIVIHLPPDVVVDELRDGAGLAQRVSQDVSQFRRPRTVRISFNATPVRAGVLSGSVS